MINLDRALRSSLKTGKVVLGSNQAVECGQSGKAKLLIYSADCPLEVRSVLEKMDVPVYAYESSGKDLGASCGKPFPVAALAIIEPGESEVMALLREIRGVDTE